MNLNALLLLLFVAFVDFVLCALARRLMDSSS